MLALKAPFENDANSVVTDSRRLARHMPANKKIQSPSATPFFSVVTPKLNRGELLREALESVRAQNAADVEHLVLDGRLHGSYGNGREGFFKGAILERKGFRNV